ncbi:MAG: RNA polymerase sigma factor [Planctomycetota bacterium]
MKNPFSGNEQDTVIDEELVTLALEGKKKALEELVRRHQSWIFNIALRMTGDPEDAEDVTQEVLLVILTKLSTFRRESRFRTWIYRIVANHVLTMKKRKLEKVFSSFDHYGEAIDGTPNNDPPDPKTIPVDLPLLLEEIRTLCMMGMLLCLDREQRLIFVLGEIFGMSDAIGSEIFEISRDNFRKKLSRARQSVHAFMKERCGLVHEDNSCLCARKAKTILDKKEIDPSRLRFHGKNAIKVSEIFEEKQARFLSYIESRCLDLFRQDPFMEPPEFVRSFRKILGSREFRDIFDLKE